MIALEDLKVTEKEFKIRKIWKYLTWANYSVVLLILLAVCVFNTDPKLISAVFFMFIFVSVGFWICFVCAYRSPGVWLLRFGVLGLCCQFAKQIFEIVLIIYFSTAAKYATSPKVLWISALILILLNLLPVANLYVSYRLIYINKKIQCTKYLSQDEMNDLKSLKSSNDPAERATIYNKLTTRNGRMQWIFKRVWKNKKALITRW